MGDSEAQAGGPAQAAWRELLDVLRDADQSFLDPARGDFDELEIADGYRNLTSILTFAYGMYMRVDRDWPIFLPSAEGPARRDAPRRASRRRVPVGRDPWRSPLPHHRTARRRGLPLVHRARRPARVGAAAAVRRSRQPPRPHDRRRRPVRDPRRPEPPDRPRVAWLSISPDVNEIYARAYHLDIEHDRRAEYTIEPLDAPTPVTFDSLEVADRLRQMATAVRDVTLAMPQPLTNPNVMGETWTLDAHRAEPDVDGARQHLQPRRRSGSSPIRRWCSRARSSRATTGACSCGRRSSRRVTTAATR